MTDEDINNLIQVEKQVTKAPPKSYKVDGSNRRKDFKVASADGKTFTVFLRQNLEFQENFSIGLLYHFEGIKVMLLRANGNHGQVVEDPQRPSPHFGYHIHKLTASEFESGKYYDPKFSSKTDNYSSFEEAIAFFIRHTNIENGLKYFSDLNQLPLFQN